MCLLMVAVLSVAEVPRVRIPAYSYCGEVFRHPVLTWWTLAPLSKLGIEINDTIKEELFHQEAEIKERKLYWNFSWKVRSMTSRSKFKDPKEISRLQSNITKWLNITFSEIDLLRVVTWNPVYLYPVIKSLYGYGPILTLSLN